MSNHTKKLENEIVFTLNDIIEDRFARYAKYIIQDRALPDVRDGLKPVQRRILYAMNDLRLFHNASYKKSARVVGEVIGKYHPHGDSSVYEAMIRLSQSWKLRLPLIDMHGNNGSIDGDPAAAMRYTETRLSEIASFLLQDLDKDTVTFAPNFDDSEKEPVVLPALFPNLLVNGATGIAAGYATNIAPHNLHEVIKATIHRINNPTCNLKSILNYIQGPDFPTGGIIQGKEGIIDAYKTGKGKIIVRSKIIKEKDHIVITEIPYEVVKQDLVKKIDDIRYNSPGLNIKEVRDETDRHGLRIVIELNKKANFETVRKYLIKNTNLQITYNFNFVAIANKNPKQLGLLEVLDYYIIHQQEVVLNRAKFDLAKNLKRAEIVDGLIKAIGILDEIIKIIRHSKDRGDAINNLIKRFAFTFIQAEAIVQLRLYRLTSTDIYLLQNEAKELQELIKQLNLIISDQTELNKVIIDQLKLIDKKFNSPRKSFIEDNIEVIEIKDTETLLKRDIAIWVSKDGYLKAYDATQIDKINFTEFARKPNDLWVSHLIANTLDKLLIITSNGNYVIVPIHKIKLTRVKEIGNHLNTLVELSGEEKVIAVYVLNNFNQPNIELMLATKNGLIKQTILNEFEAVRISKAIKAINLKNDDKLITCTLNEQQKYYLTVTKNGFVSKYQVNEIPTLGLKTAGVKAVTLKDDYVINTFLVNDNDNILLIDNNNKYKKLAVKDIDLFARPAKGMHLIKKNNKISNEIQWAIKLEEKNEEVDVLNKADILQKFDITKNIKSSKLTDNFIDFSINDLQEIQVVQYYDLRTIINRNENLDSANDIESKKEVILPEENENNFDVAKEPSTIEEKNGKSDLTLNLDDILKDDNN